MSFFRTLKTRYQKHCETSENHQDKDMKTRYYKGNFNKIFQAAEEVVKADSSSRIKSLLKEHGEIAVEINRELPCFMIVSIITVKPYETAVDVTISTEKFSIAGVNPLLRKEILRFYDRLGQKQAFLER